MSGSKAASHTMQETVLRFFGRFGFDYRSFYKSSSPGVRAADLFLVSFLGLFFEVLLIRWLGSETRIIAYYKNLVLLACFLGLGLGFNLARRKRSYFALFVPLLCIFSVFILLASRFGLFQLLRAVPPGTQQLWGFHDAGRWVSFLFFYLFVVGIFVATALIFVPVGQLTGVLMTQFRPIPAYSMNIAGSVAGVAVYAMISYWSLTPSYWYFLGLVPAVWLLRVTGSGWRWGTVWSSVVIVAFLLLADGSYWSPYQKILVTPLENPETGYLITTNQSYHQRILNLADRFVSSQKGEGLQSAANSYSLPYHFVNKPRRVLVIGAGTGNDVAAALRSGAEHVDAVEIDPVILHLGRELHPEHPYDSKRVRLILNDARPFVRKSKGKYDLIVYGLVDSHTMLSGKSTVRLDNFIYTVESFREARRLLAKNGVMTLSFSVGKRRLWIADRIRVMLREAFGAEPIAFLTKYDGGFMFIAGANASDVVIPAGVEPLSIPHTGVTSATDNWPFLYMREHALTKGYLGVIVVLLALSVLMTVRVFPEARQVNAHFFFLGAAFLLVEVKGITELALVYGTTWVVNSIVLTAILLAILAANAVAAGRQKQDLKAYYALLLSSVALGYWVPVSAFLGSNAFLRFIIPCLLLFLPVFFAGIIFASSLKRTTSVERAFGSNLLGAMFGGFLEYASLSVGIRALYLIALGLYGLSYVALGRRQT